MVRSDIPPMDLPPPLRGWPKAEKGRGYSPRRWTLRLVSGEFIRSRADARRSLEDRIGTIDPGFHA